MGKNYKPVLNADFVSGAVPGKSLGNFPRGYGTISPQLYCDQQALSPNYRIPLHPRKSSMAYRPGTFQPLALARIMWKDLRSDMRQMPSILVHVNTRTAGLKIDLIQGAAATPSLPFTRLQPRHVFRLTNSLDDLGRLCSSLYAFLTTVSFDWQGAEVQS
jgi:hypothetical protein